MAWGVQVAAHSCEGGVQMAADFQEQERGEIGWGLEMGLLVERSQV